MKIQNVTSSVTSQRGKGGQRQQQKQTEVKSLSGEIRRVPKQSLNKRENKAVRKHVNVLAASNV